MTCLFLDHIEKGAPYVFRDTFNCVFFSADLKHAKTIQKKKKERK